MIRLPRITWFLAALAQFVAVTALSITVLPWFLGAHHASPLTSLASVAVGALAGHIATRTRSYDNVALAGAAAVIALVDALGSRLLGVGLGHSLAWGIVAFLTGILALVMDRAPTVDLVRRHLILSAVWAGLAILLGSLGSPHGLLVGDLGLLALPCMIIAYAAVHTAERTGRAASREALLATVGLTVLAVVLVLPAVRSALSAAVEAVLWGIVMFVTYVIFWPLSGLIAALMRLLRRHVRQSPPRQTISALGRHHGRLGAHVPPHPFGPPTAFWAILAMCLFAAFVIWLIGRGRRPASPSPADYREEIHPMPRHGKARTRRLPPPPGLRRQYAESLSLLMHAGILPRAHQPGRTAAELLREVNAFTADPPETPTSQDRVGPELSTVKVDFGALSALYSRFMYGPAPPPGTHGSQDVAGARLLASLHRAIGSVHVALGRDRPGTPKARRGSHATSGTKTDAGRKRPT